MKITASVVNVWQHNMYEQLSILSKLLSEHNVVALDTEFPKFLRNPPRRASEEDVYRAIKLNVDRQKLIQLGFTLSDTSGSMPISNTNKTGSSSCCLSWQFNFRDYNPSSDGVPSLRKSGIDLEKNMQDGIDAHTFSGLLRELLCPFRGHLKWLTFHGMYDIAYLVKLLTQQPLPRNLDDFLCLARDILGDFFDVKYLARFCDGLLDGETSLKRLCFHLLNVRIGRDAMFHQAGYDSLMTSAAFWAMKAVHNLREQQGTCILYGIDQQCLELFIQQQQVEEEEQHQLMLEQQHQQQIHHHHHHHQQQQQMRRFMPILPNRFFYPAPFQATTLPPLLPIMKAAPPPSTLGYFIRPPLPPSQWCHY